ncbi:amino acid ABC transporter permease [Thermoflavimicrobium daqui]|jgi:putative glutamine transport system permease protein|uniref:Glutamine ABC transporter permease n=1 Tax=Thermoflavimicrobium daqui TaxID=2137476 RepID=A0A364K525_9BACL|nr:amino acid ABC transporter permease [Thermoflavimicrobium daqui]RAL24369.1 glutamine ABC transporter permease [Thermoflavimicrobium daqui]
MDFSFLEVHKEDFIDGFFTTLSVSLVALVLSLIIGTIMAVLRISHSKILRGIGTAYVEFFRNTPIIIQVFFFYFGLASIQINLSKFMVGSLGLAFYTGAFMAEAIRAGIQAVPKGQMEAARSSGLTYIQAMWYVILPQAFKMVIPPLGNQFINLVKNSSILAIIAGTDLLYAADIAIANYDVTSVYVFVALLYLVITIPLSIGVNYLEKRWSKQG